MQQVNKTINKEEIILNAIARVLNKLRREKNLSQRMLAFENSIQKSLISRLESAKNKPQFLSIWKIAEALELKPSKFVQLIEKELPDDFSLIDE